jgi:hypothetical protein
MAFIADATGTDMTTVLSDAVQPPKSKLVNIKRNRAVLDADSVSRSPSNTLNELIPNAFLSALHY